MSIAIEKINPDVRLPDRMQAREAICELEKAVAELPGAVHGDCDEAPLNHAFADGIYVREIIIPAGFFCVGKIHKYAHPNFLMKGDVSVVTEHRGIKRIQGPKAMISMAGTKRVVFAHTECVWITVHRTDALDPESAEDDVIAKDYDDLPDDIKDIAKEIK